MVGEWNNWGREEGLCPWNASSWWKDIMSLEEGVGSNFNSEVVRHVGDGGRT